MNFEANLQDGTVFLWHRLPALAVDDKIALFSNVDGQLQVIELEKSELDDESVYQYAKQNKLFDCLTASTDIPSDTITLVITLTKCCNSLCRYCFLSANTDGKTMTEDMVYSVIDKVFDLAKGKKLVISFLGGEPTVKFKLIETAVLYAEQHPLKIYLKNLRFGITTNGIFNDKMTDFFIKHNFKISVSLDGVPEVQDFHRPLANGSKPSPIIERGISKLAKVLPIKTLGTVTRFSVDKMAESVEYFAKLGIKRVFFNPVTKRGRALTDDKMLQPPTVDSFVDNLKKAILVGEKLGVNVISFPYMNLMSSPMKYCDGSRIVINYNGDVSSCVEIQDREHPLFKDFKIGYYDENKHTVVLDKQAHKCSETTTARKKCQECPLFFFCGEGCPARNYIGSADRYKIDDYRCLITKKIMPFILKKVYLATYNNTSGRIKDDSE